MEKNYCYLLFILISLTLILTACVPNEEPDQETESEPEQSHIDDDTIQDNGTQTNIDNETDIGDPTYQPPTFEPEGGSYSTNLKVTLSTTPPDAIIYYTTDGSEPTVSSSQYSSPILVNKETTIKAFAETPNHTFTSVITQNYIIKKEWEQVPLRTIKQKDAGFMGGEGMQMIWGLSYAPTNSNIVYLASDTSQVWKSEDGGASWQLKNRGFLANGGVSLAVDPNDENFVLVAGSQLDSGTDDQADGIYRTQNGGESWELVYPTAYYRMEPMKGGVHFAFTEENTIYAGTHEDGLLKSVDGGDTWNSLNVLKDDGILDVKAHPQNTFTIFLATPTGLYKLIDGHLPVLEQIGKTLPDSPRTIAVHPTNGNILYVAVGKSGIYKSIDGGNTFDALNNGLEPLTWDDGFEAISLAISPVNPNHLYAGFYLLGGNHPYYSHDGGNTWASPSVMDEGGLIFDLVNESGGEFWGTPIAPSPVDENVAISSGAGNHIEKTADGGQTWRFSGDGYTGGRAGTASTSFGWDVNNPNRFAFFLIDFGPFLTTDGGSTFKSLNLPRHHDALTTPVGALDWTSESKVIVTAVGDWSNQVIAVTEDEGENWTLFNDTEDSYEFIAFHPQNADIVYAGKYRSTNKGKDWTEIDKKIIALFPKNGDVVYAKEINAENTTLFKSIDGGNSWTQPYDDIPSIDVNEIVIDPENQDRIYVATLWTGIYIWEENQWGRKTETDGLEKDQFDSLSTRNLTIDPNHPNVIYAGRWISFKGHANGIFRSLDFGKTWENITYNLGPEFTTWAISVNPNNGYVYLGSSHGTWKLPQPSETGESVQVSLSTFNPIEGKYDQDQIIQIANTTENATIYYTLDGTDPTTDSNIYATPISLANHGSSLNIKALAIKEGMLPSDISSATYTVKVNKPTFDPPANTYVQKQTITINSSTEGATIYYTTDGSKPSATSLQYTEPVQLNHSATLKALAIKENLGNSDIVEAQYQFPSGNEQSPLGINLSFTSSWSNDWVFTDVFRVATKWIPHEYEDYWVSGQAWDTNEDNKLDLDDNGWVKSLPADNSTDIYRTVGAITLQSSAAQFPEGQFIVLYDGEGTIQYGGSATKNNALSTHGRDVIDVVNGETGIWVQIIDTDPNNTGNYIRNIRVIAPGGSCSNDRFQYCEDSSACSAGGICQSFEDTYLTERFHPYFLRTLRKFKVIRSMPWTNAWNDSPIENWSDRPHLGEYSWAIDVKGVPLEVIVDLSNKLNADAWLNVVPRANDDFIQNMAKHVRDTLNPDLKVYIEYANEVWNPAEGAGDWSEAQGIVTWPDSAADDYTKRLNWYAKRVIEMCDIWKTVWADEKERVVCVMAGQSGSLWRSEQIMDCPLWTEGAPCYAQDSVDAFAISPYFGGYLGEASREATVISWTSDADGGLDKLFDEIFNGGVITDISTENGALARTYQQVDQHIQAAQVQRGLELVAYEGGHHLRVFSNNATIGNLFASASRDERMGTAFTQLLENWKNKGLTLFNVYSNVTASDPRLGAAFGLKEYPQQTSTVKFDAVMDFIENNPCWWGECETSTVK